MNPIVVITDSSKSSRCARLGRTGRKRSSRPFAREVAQVLLGRQSRGHLVERELGAGLRNLQVAEVGDAHGVRDRLGHLGEDPRHLVGGLEEELGELELHPPALGHLLARADADQDVLGPGVLAPGVVHVVGGHQRDAGRARDLDQGPVDGLLLGDAVVLQLQPEPVGSEQLAVAQAPAPAPRRRAPRGSGPARRRRGRRSGRRAPRGGARAARRRRGACSRSLRCSRAS